MKKILSFVIILLTLLTNTLSVVVAVPTDGRASPWTREKAAQLAKSTLFNADATIINTLFAAGSASAALDILFPSINGPERTAFDTAITTYTSSGFNWGDGNHSSRLYQLLYSADPYEAKRKLFSLYEDIFSVSTDSSKDVTFKDIYDLHSLLYDNLFGNYETLVKKMINNNGGKGDYAEGAYLDLFNQKDPKQPNENFSRELLQLFIMGEYEPYRSKDNNDARNYEETDVRALAKILTGLRAQPITHATSFNLSTHFTGSSISFLTGAYSGVVPPYYSNASGTINPIDILNPVNGNNGLTDNIVEYIFAKRGDQIALFLADRIARFYMNDTPSRTELDFIAQIIKNNNFEMFPALKAILALDMMYSDASMNSVRYKNPLELNIGTIRFLHGNAFTGIISDPNVYDSNLLRRLGWTPYFPGSVFGRDGFDNSLKWSSTSTQGAWMNASNYFTYRISGTGAVDFLSVLGNQKKELTNEVVDVMTHADNSFTGNLQIVSGTLELGSTLSISEDLQVTPLGSNQGLEVATPLSIEEHIIQNGYPLDPVESILGGENLEFYKSELYEWVNTSLSFVEDEEVPVPLPPSITTPAPKAVDTGVFLSVPESTGQESTPDAVIQALSGEKLALTESGTFDAGIRMASGGNTNGTSLIESVPVMTGSVGQTSLSQEKAETPLLTVGLTEKDTGNTTADEGSGSISSPGSGEESGKTLPREGTGILVTLKPQVESPQPGVVGSASGGISTGYVIFPNFQVITDLGSITISGGTYNAGTKTLIIRSGVLRSSGSTIQILSGSILFDGSSRLIADTISTDGILDAYENYIYGERRLQSDARMSMKDFLTQNASGTLIPVAPTNVKYFNKNIRGLLSILLSQPEYVLLHGYDLPTMIDPDESNFLDNVTGKLFFIELYGGNDYMTSIIPKDEYATYTDYRTNQSGSIAISGSLLVDIGDFYMNKNLAFGSGGSPGFKSLYDQGYLKIFNRVGGYKHSNDHDAAAKQISSYDSSTNKTADGVFGHLVQKEFESSHTISLGAKLPNVYRSGHYINLGGNVILTNPLDQGGQWKSHMDRMVTIIKNRVYPANTRNLFKDAGRISEIGKISVTQGGPPGASGNMDSVFKFAKVLMNNNIGRAFYMGGAGGYDTHGNQFAGLNNNLLSVNSAVTTFFNDVKDMQDVTIVIFSEFGRTNRTNGDLGTDHGDGGGMFVITSNQNLRNQLSAGTYGNMSIKNSKTNSLGVGIDYRSVYGKIYNSLYGLDGATYFADPSVSLENDMSLEKNDISLLNFTHLASNTTTFSQSSFAISGKNYNPGKSGYTTFSAGTGTDNLKILNIGVAKFDGTRYKFKTGNQVFQSTPFYRIRTYSNQYAINEYLRAFTGSDLPRITPGRLISLSGSSILPLFNNNTAPRVLAGSGLILNASGSSLISLTGSNFEIQFSSGVTSAIEITSTSGSVDWNGGFILGESIDREYFMPRDALLVSSNIAIPKSNIIRLNKIGTDSINVGMKLNQPLELKFTNLSGTGNYRVITSDDGIVWNDVEGTGQLYMPDVNGKIAFKTNHFSYFALLSDTAVVQLPTCTVSINPTSITNGSGASLSWALQNSITGVLNPGNIPLGVSGLQSIIPPSDATTQYTITTNNAAGSGKCSASVTASPRVVPSPPPVLPPSCVLSSNPSSVQNGSGTTLFWIITNTSTGVINPGNILIGASGSQVVIPPVDATTKYTLSVMNAFGSTNCSTSVTASPAAPPPIVPSCTLSANPMTLVNGGTTTLSWSLQNASTGILSPGNILLSNIVGTLAVTPPGSATTQYRITTSNITGSGNCMISVTAVSGLIPPPLPSPPNVGPGGGGGGGTPSPLQGNNLPCLSSSCKNQMVITKNQVPGTPKIQQKNVLRDTLMRLQSLTSSGNISREEGISNIIATLGTSVNDSLGEKRAYEQEIFRNLYTSRVTQSSEGRRSINTIILGLRTLLHPLNPITSWSFTFNDVSTDEPLIPEKSRDLRKKDKEDSLYVQAETSLTLRSSPSSKDGSNILYYIPRNEKVGVLDQDIVWTYVRYDDLSGYVRTEYLRSWNPSDDIRRGIASKENGPKSKVNVIHSLYTRERSNIYSKITGILYTGDVVTILDTFGQWSEVMTDTFRGYVIRRFLSRL